MDQSLQITGVLLDHFFGHSWIDGGTVSPSALAVAPLPWLETYRGRGLLEISATELAPCLSHGSRWGCWYGVLSLGRLQEGWQTAHLDKERSGLLRMKPMLGIRRREFIATLAGATAWPIAARPEQSAIPVVGFLNATDYDYRVAAFRHGLEEMGYVEDRNVKIEYRWAQGRYDLLPAMAADLVRRKVAVIAAGGGESVALPAKAATTTIPIVFTVGADPVKAGVVAGLNRPGGNVTGVFFLIATLGPKQIQLLHDAVPGTAVLGYLQNPSVPAAVREGQEKDVQTAAQALGLKLVVANAATNRDFEDAFASLKDKGVGALLVSSNAYFNNQRNHLVALSEHYAIPTIYSYREFAEAGGLMSYGTSVSDAYRLMGVYVGRILKGEKPADLPVLQPTKLEFVINLKTARMLGLDVPPTLRALADEVIE
jgi:putative ABC transport system substrate-binding protein